MAKSYSVADARTHLPEILNEVEMGKDVQLTRRGRPVGVVLSVARYEALQSTRVRFTDAYAEFLHRHPAGAADLDSRFFGALRDRRPARPVDL